LLKSLKEKDQACKAGKYFCLDFPKLAALEPIRFNVAIEQSTKALIEDSLAIALALGWKIDEENSNSKAVRPKPGE
jgi:hypothetical protein